GSHGKFPPAVARTVRWCAHMVEEGLRPLALTALVTHDAAVSRYHYLFFGDSVPPQIRRPAGRDAAWRQAPSDATSPGRFRVVRHRAPCARSRRRPLAFDCVHAARPGGPRRSGTRAPAPGTFGFRAWRLIMSRHSPTAAKKPAVPSPVPSWRKNG